MDWFVTHRSNAMLKDIDNVFPLSVLCQSSDNVAFTLGQTSHLYLSHGEQIAYNKVITNNSATFDPQGSFICKNPGIYAFHFFSLAHTQSRIWIELYKNTNYICSTYGYTSHGYADAGNSVLLHLNTNDHVTIRTHSSHNTTLYGTDNQIYTTFTGILLSSDVIEYEYKKVSFSVGLDHRVHAANGKIVLYNDIILASSAYNSRTGVFTAPLDGTYIFHYHGLAQNNKTVWLELYHNHDYVTSAWGHTESGYADAGNTVILHLFSGDQVYVKTRNKIPVDLFGSTNQVYTTFSGNMLAPLTHNLDDSLSEISFSAGQCLI
ncbi:complement C1q tumor necrosis factor-related protein 4-like [Ostrea edulis]|uniref:complement C1q tumor necrosis factor-related protein 4-like n=1 Tax=Ostrea edulis TaxID=37623 RepID=UPI0024AEE887|nr:complement C1q tumor necrosis factor-related protein 4-like [Ostrea edulis]